MRDAMGGSVALVIIVVFIVIALGYMAFNVNYTKAFRMKNKIITIYDNYNGNCDSACNGEIVSYAKTIGYTLGQSMSCDGYNGKGVNGLYCYDEVTNKGGLTGNSKYYRIITKINVEIPIINRILDLKVLYITGDTKTYKID